MSRGFILRSIPLAAAQITLQGATNGINPAFPVGNLADRQPKIVAQGNPVAGVGVFTLAFAIDLLADTPIDTIAIMFTNLSADSSWVIAANTAAQGPVVSVVPGNTVLDAAFGVAATTRADRKSVV